jgi:hypothetical protein
MTTPGPLDPGSLIQPAIDSVQSGLGDVAGPALLVGAAVLAIGVGWKFAKRFVRG